MNNMEAFAQELGTMIDQKLTIEHIHPSTTGRFYYIQAPEEGSPMLLHHYRGPYFVDMHPNDIEKIQSGTVSPYDYISNANWLVGYYWGGGSMVGGGFYQPINIVERQEEVKRYLKILQCRGIRTASGYMPTERQCFDCPVKDCPFSEYKVGTWENELEEHDPRIDLFKALLLRFENEFPDYTFRGFLCSKNVQYNTILLSPNGHYSEKDPYSFTIYASENVIRDLLMKRIQPEDWDEYAKAFKFVLHKNFTEEYLDPTLENIKAIFKDVDYVEKEKQAATEQDTELLMDEEKPGIIARICGFFKHLF